MKNNDAQNKAGLLNDPNEEPVDGSGALSSQSNSLQTALSNKLQKLADTKRIVPPVQQQDDQTDNPRYG